MTGDIWKNLFSADVIDGIRVRMQRNVQNSGIRLRRDEWGTSWIFVELAYRRQDSFGAVR